METIHSRGKDIEIPAFIDELKPEQYEYFCCLAMMLGSGTIDIDKFRVRWLSYLIGLGAVDYLILKEEHVLELNQQREKIFGFFDADTGSPLLECEKNLLPSYRGFTGPGDWLDGVSFGEFVDCLNVLTAGVDEDSETVMENYCHVARVLYKIPDDAEVPDILALHAPMLLMSVWKALQREPVTINGEKIDFRIIFKSAGNSRPDDKTGWTGILFEVASAGIFGKVEEVERTDMWAVLLYLYRCKFEYLHEQKNSK